MLRLVDNPAVAADDPRLDDWAKETVEHWQRLADAHRAIANSGCFTLLARHNHEQMAGKVEEKIDAYVRKQTGGHLGVVAPPEDGPFVDELVPGHGLTPRACNALKRAGYRTVERARIFLDRLPADIEEVDRADLPSGIGYGIVQQARAAIAQWDADTADEPGDLS